LEATLRQLADLVEATVRGDPATLIHGVAGIQQARPGELALLADARYHRYLATTGASALLVGGDFDVSATPLPLLLAGNPGQAMDTIAAHLCPARPAPEPGIHPTALVAPDAAIGSGVAIGAYCVVESGASLGDGTVLRPFVFVGRGVRIGSRCLLHPRAVVLDGCVLGDRVTLHSGAVIGADGFGYETRDGLHHKLTQRGIVELGNDVEIGANSTVDRARYGRTFVGAGTKIDNLVMVAHNDVIGEHCLLIGQCGIAGSTALGHHVVVAAQAGLVGHIEVGDGAIIGAQAGVTKSVPAGLVVLGSPAQDIQKERRSLALHQNLPELARRLRELGKAVEQLQEKVERLGTAATNDSEAR